MTATLAPRRPLEAWRAEFPILAGQVYLASNCMGAAPRGLEAALAAYAREHFAHGEHGWAAWLPWLQAAADRIARLIGAPAGSVVLDSSVTTFQHRIAGCLDFRGPRRRVVMCDLDFPSVRYAWGAWSRYGAESVVVRSDTVHVPVEELLDAVDERTSAVVVSLATYGSGALADVRRLAARARDAGALTVVDAFQAFGVVPVDVADLGVDVLVSGTRKFAMGCGESAFMYVRPELADDLHPLLAGWFGHEDPLAFAAEFRPAPGVARFGLGTPLVLPHFAASAGLDVLEEVGVERIRAHSLALTSRVIALADAQGIGVGTPRAAGSRAGVVTLRFPEAARVAERLNVEGYVCSYRPGCGLRVGPHFYNTIDEIDRFMDRLHLLRQKEMP